MVGSATQSLSVSQKTYINKFDAHRPSGGGFFIGGDKNARIPNLPRMRVNEPDTRKRLCDLPRLRLVAVRIGGIFASGKVNCWMSQHMLG
jgi:hypothetical protein